ESGEPAVPNGPEDAAPQREDDAAPDEAARSAEGQGEAEESGGSPPPAPTTPVAKDAPEPKSNKRWYVVKVQSGREESIKEAIERRVKIEGLEEAFGQIIIPVEKVTEMRNGKRVVRERKLYPGYL